VIPGVGAVPLERIKALKPQRGGEAGLDGKEGSEEGRNQQEGGEILPQQGGLEANGGANHTAVCTDGHVDCTSWAIAGLCQATNASDAHQTYRTFVLKTCCESCHGRASL